jgi:ribosomal protein S18 acetylase RimI-like enzyme
MKPAVVVRTAELADVAELVRLTEDTVVSPGRVKAGGGRSGRYVDLLAAPDRAVLVAVDDKTDRIVGVVVASEDEIGALEPVRALVISQLVVGLADRRRGVGRSLLSAVVRHATELGIDQIVVAVATNDRDANRYLARLGFAPLVVRRIANTAVLRRSLGMTEGFDRGVLRRRRMTRGVMPTRVVSRGA